ncbi:hypothetical protein PQU92_13435 [Asticcacaulis sp. BYS171W]|uniref:Uncharacterized protein n=1 Tax=Asticcacaulis aquaticus TaxID=2984212 RepID=A0ABT5HW17_9CAUL|nr:hypothetical protein [Asticcacaulis aquaticus]MDC7684286.1 hypothetical protein [Asticcacaulis aquaticus]
MDYFHQYWWLIFPILGMGMGFFSMYSAHRARTEKIRLIRFYVEQGKEPPPALLATLSDNDSTDGCGGTRSGRITSLVSAFTVFAALALAFGYTGWRTGETVFIALGLGFAPAALIMLILLIYRLRTERKD